MSDLLINWLNDEVQLSTRISNFEEDFHNGYLFGELLSKYSQQLNFNQFVNRDDKASRIINFSLLYDTFKSLRVSFDSNIAMAIIEKKMGIAKKVLYELKMQLEKTTSNAFTKLNKPAKPLSPLKKIPLSKEKFDKISKQHFTKQLNQLHRAQKNINIDGHLSKFPEFHQKQLVKAYNEEKKQSQGRLLGQMKFRQKQLENIKKSSDFRNQWEQSNLEKWSANMTVRKLQNQKDNDYKLKQQYSKMQNKTMSELNAIKTLDNDIKQFEKKVKAEKNIPKDSSSSQSEDEKRKTGGLPNNQSLIKKKSIRQFAKKTNQFNPDLTNKSIGEADLKKKKSPQQIEIHRHQREKRRRKMIVEQSKKHQFIKIQRRERYILNTLQQTSKQQKQIQYEIWRAWQNKQIITQNKQSYLEKLKQKQQTRTVNAKFKDDQLTKTYRQEHNKIQLKDACNRQEKLRINNSVKDRKQVYNQCRGFVENFIDMMEVLYEDGQQKNIQDLDENFVNHLMDQFVSNVHTKKQAADLELKNYICGKGEWQIEVTKDTQDQPQDPTQENALPKTTVNNYYLGNILRNVFSQLYQEKQSTIKQDSKNKNLICLLGLDFAGKQTIAKTIQQTFGFHVIRIHQLIENKIKDNLDIANRGVDTDGGNSSEIVKLAYEGKQIPNDLILQLLKEETEKHEKSLIINYPATYQQCIELTNKFGGVKPSDAITKNKLTVKIQEFSRLVWATETKKIPRSLKPCGLDFALWVDVSPKTSLDRFLGRRWTANGECVHINSEIQNPNILEIGDKASPIILKNNFKIKNKSKIQNWLNQFGIKVIDNQEQKIQLCWEAISGQHDPQNVINSAIQVFNKAIDIKNKKNIELKLEQSAYQQAQKKQAERKQFQKQLKQKCVLSTVEQISKKYQEAISSAKTSQSFLQNIQNLWNSTEKITINSFLTVFQAIREQDRSKNKHISDTKKKFIRLLTRQDQRFYLVKKFQIDYNDFYDGNHDMISQQYTKEEIHQRIQDLQTDLLTLIQEKKDDACAECDNIKNSGWLENQLEQIISYIHLLLQTELNRSFACQQILSDFYSKTKMVNTGDIGETQLTLNIDESLEFFKEGTLPRLEKLISEAMRLFNREQDVADDKNKKGGKPPPKKDDKKAAKKGGKDQVQEVREPRPEQLQYKKALNTEKSIFRYRVKIISSYAAKRLKQFQAAGTKLYEDLEDLYKYTDQIQKQSIVNMTKIFKAAVEEERKIENQVEINYTQVTETQLIRNFQKPKPVIQPASEDSRPTRFSISSLKQIINLLLNQSESKTVIKTRKLLSIFEQFSTNENYHSILPETWKNLKPNQWEYFIKKFDKNGKGQVQLWIIFEIFALTDALLPTQKELEEYELLLCDHNPNYKQIKQSKVEATPAWFEAQQPQYQNTRTFNRNKYLKTVLFDINKKDEKSQVLLLEKYIKRLGFKGYTSGQSQQNVKYFEFAFGNE